MKSAVRMPELTRAPPCHAAIRAYFVGRVKETSPRTRFHLLPLSCKSSQRFFSAQLLDAALVACKLALRPFELGAIPCTGSSFPEAVLSMARVGICFRDPGMQRWSRIGFRSRISVRGKRLCWQEVASNGVGSGLQLYFER